MKLKKLIQNHPRVEDISDERGSGDGCWVYLKRGWGERGNPQCHTIHEDTWSDVLRAVRDAEPCECDNCAGAARRHQAGAARME